MESKLKKAKENLTRKLDLPQDIVFDLPKITVIGDSEITIENHKGIVLFEEKEIKINSGIGLISIYGDNFEVLFMGGRTLALKGFFKSIVYEEFK